MLGMAVLAVFTSNVFVKVKAFLGFDAEF